MLNSSQKGKMTMEREWVGLFEGEVRRGRENWFVLGRERLFELAIMPQSGMKGKEREQGGPFDEKLRKRQGSTVLSVLVIDNGNFSSVDERERARFRWWLTPREGGDFSSLFVQDETRFRHITHPTSTRSASRSHVLLKGEWE